MSEETDSEPVIHVEFAVAGNNTGYSQNVQFADGLRYVPDHVIAGLGGPGELQKLIPDLVNVKYDEFMQGFISVMAERQINTFQANFVANHFAPKFF